MNNYENCRFGITHEISFENLGDTSVDDAYAYRDAVLTALCEAYPRARVAVKLVHRPAHDTVTDFDGDDSELVGEIDELANSIWERQEWITA